MDQKPVMDVTFSDFGDSLVPDQAPPGCIACAKRRNKRFFATYLMELQEKDLGQLKLALDVSRKEFHEQKEQWEDERTMKMEKETESDSMVKIQKEEISKLKLSLDQWKQELRQSESDRMKMLKWQQETTSILQSQNQQISNLSGSDQRTTRELHHQETTISEAQKNVIIKDEELKVKDLLVREQNIEKDVLRDDLRQAQQKFKSQSHQHDRLLEVVKSKEQVKEKVTLLKNALVVAQNQLKAKDVELEEERSSHAKKKPLRKRIHQWFTRKTKH